MHINILFIIILCDHKTFIILYLLFSHLILFKCTMRDCVQNVTRKASKKQEMLITIRKSIAKK
jgi:hypothetical protein